MKAVKKGDKVSRIYDKVDIKDLKTKYSYLTDQVVLNSNKNVKQRLIQYNLKLDTDNGPDEKGLKVPEFVGKIQIKV